MKKMFLGIVFSIFTFVGIALSGTSAQAAYFLGMDGLYYGNVCRAGVYWQFVPYKVVGSTCYMPGWNLYGTIVFE
jgi:hypothetical protein